MLQSAVGDRVTVNFKHVGKQTINAGRVALELAPGDGNGDSKGDIRG